MTTVGPSDLYTITIAGISFVVHASGLDPTPRVPRTYAPFFSREPAIGIGVDCTLGLLPRFAAPPQLDAGPWRVYPSTDGPCFISRTGAPDELAALTWISAERRLSLTVASQSPPPSRHAPLFSYPLDFLGTLLALDDGVVLHAAAAVIDGAAHVFVGRSGVGKSTVARKLERHGAILSDERVIMRRSASGYQAWGTPWASSLGAALNESAPLVALYLIAQSKENRITRLSPEALRDELVACTSIPVFHTPAMDCHLSALTELSHSVPGFRFAMTLGCPILEMVRGNN